jgi:hypothetical protein
LRRTTTLALVGLTTVLIAASASGTTMRKTFLPASIIAGVIATFSSSCGKPS